MTTETNTEEEIAALATQDSRAVLEQATSLTISSVEEDRAAAVQLVDIKTRLNQVEGQRKRIVQPFQEGVKRVNDLFRPAIEYLTNAERILKASRIDWQRKERQRQQDEEAAAREAQRIEQERLTAQADVAAAEGNEVKATVLAEMAEDVRLPAVAPVERVAGTSVRQVWHAEVTDKRALIQAVLLGKVSLDAVEPNMPFLNQLARERKDAFDVPGAKAVMEESMAVRT